MNARRWVVIVLVGTIKVKIECQQRKKGGNLSQPKCILTTSQTGVYYRQRIIAGEWECERWISGRINARTRRRMDYFRMHH